jgi:hypothetical protein
MQLGVRIPPNLYTTRVGVCLGSGQWKFMRSHSLINFTLCSLKSLFQGSKSKLYIWGRKQRQQLKGNIQPRKEAKHIADMYTSIHCASTPGIITTQR